MITFVEVFKDPDFQGLPFEEKKRFMLKTDPDFAGLPGLEQNKFIKIVSVEEKSDARRRAGLAGLREKNLNDYLDKEWKKEVPAWDSEIIPVWGAGTKPVDAIEDEQGRPIMDEANKAIRED